MVVPKAYLGWCTEMQENARFEWSGKSLLDGAWYSTSSEALERFQCWDADTIVQRLWEMYFAQESRSLLKFEATLKALIRYHADRSR